MKLQDYENAIEAGLNDAVDSILAVGKSLSAIKEQQLYKPEYRSFRAYVQERWGFKSPYAYHLIDAAIALDALQEHFDRGQLPKTPSAARMMARLQPKEMVEVWSEVLRRSDRPGRVGRGTVIEVIEDLGLTA